MLLQSQANFNDHVYFLRPKALAATIAGGIERAGEIFAALVDFLEVDTDCGTARPLPGTTVPPPGTAEPPD